MAEVIETIPPLRKAAILVILLGDTLSSDLLKLLSEDEVQKISEEIARIRRITPQQAEQVLDEYYRLTMARINAAQGGLEYAKRLLIKTFGAEPARRLVDLLVKSLGNETASFDALQKINPRQLAKFIHNEHPQTIALILSHLVPSQSAALLSSLAPALRSDVIVRMANLDQISPELIQRIAAVMGQKLKNLGEYSRESYGGVRAAAEICNRLDSGASKELLDEIEQTDSTLASTIRQMMFVFEDILLINDIGMTELLNRIERKLLTVALKGTSEQLQSHVMRFMTKRAQEMLREDMEAMGPVRIRDVEAAQQQIIGVVRQLEQEGVLSLHAGEERYVM